ncbi:MAG: glycosyltransferase family 4 protein [Candidatus Cloacimonadaceae bacterium]|jgi:teichuronic acid biosynthesis glycosyltransferase TuaC
MDNKAKKLLIITDMFPRPENPTDGVFVLHQVQALTEHYQVRVFSSWFPAKAKVQVRQQPEYDVVQVYYPQSRIFSPFTSYYYYKYALPKLKEVLDSFDPDIIHVHDCRHLPELLCMQDLLGRHPARKILTVHNIKTLPERTERPWLKSIYRNTLPRAYRIWDKVLFVNQRLLERMRDIVPSHKSLYIGNAIIPTPECPDESISHIREKIKSKNFNILSVGNLVNTKGFDILIQAFAQLQSQYKDISLTIIGSGKMRKKLTNQIISLGLEEQINMIPAQPNEIVRNCYKCFDLFALPSYSETFGIVYIEAMEAGLPVIGVRGQGIDGVVRDGVNGLLCEPRNVADLVSKIRWVINNREAATKLACAGQMHVREHYMMDKFIPKLIDIYES